MGTLNPRIFIGFIDILRLSSLNVKFRFVDAPGSWRVAEWRPQVTMFSTCVTMSEPFLIDFVIRRSFEAKDAVGNVERYANKLVQIAASFELSALSSLLIEI